ncbi:MAG: hypothetical protein LUI13_10350 [Lachnospiraceae bacterium]|nr:hypothetical protein [Lachnospiraceae bacterium]
MGADQRNPELRPGKSGRGVLSGAVVPAVGAGRGEREKRGAGEINDKTHEFPAGGCKKYGENATDGFASSTKG